MKSYRLADVIRIKHGYAFSGEYIRDNDNDNGIVLVTPGNFKIGGGFQEDKCKFYTGDIPNEYILKGGDLVVTMTDLSKTIDTLGYSAYIPLSSRIYLHNQRIGLVTLISDEFDKDYIYWLMRTQYYQRKIANSSTGATVHHTSPSKIYEFKFEAPDINVQKKISSILTSYEKLIENNNKRIKILEQMAENLYKEWFVRFRFPGYETAEFVDGVPKAWMFKRVEQIGKIVAGGTPSTKIDEYWNGDIPWLTPADLSSFSGIYISRGSIDISELGLRKSSAVMLPTNTVLLSSRAPIGYVALAKNPIATNQGFKSVICNEDIVNCYYLFYFFKMNKSLLESFGSGATFLELSAKGLSRMKILIPSFDIQNKFGKFISKIADEVDMLQQQNQNLIKQRDYLLPRLISGKLQVK